MKAISSLKLKHFVFVLILILLGWTSFSAYSIASYANYSTEIQVDGVIVLGAAVWGSQPSPVFRERINHAIELYENGYTSVLIFTGGKSDNNRLAESEVAKQYAVDHGIPANDILVETVSRTTEQNLYYAKQLVVNHNLTNLIIVSDPLHMKRAMLIAKDMELQAYSSPTPTTRYRSWQTQLEFLMRETYYYQRYLLRRSFYRYSP
jgi:uncharacterized SAM-binding protein YcdF (DUF218 family)